MRSITGAEEIGTEERPDNIAADEKPNNGFGKGSVGYGLLQLSSKQSYYFLSRFKRLTCRR